MMFNLSEILRNNLIDGFRNGSFSKAQIIIFASNYVAKEMLSEEDFATVLDIFTPED